MNKEQLILVLRGEFLRQAEDRNEYAVSREDDDGSPTAEIALDGDFRLDELAEAILKAL